MCFETECVMALQASRPSKVVDFGTNRKRVCSFLFVINCNLCPILPHFRDVAGFLLKSATPPLFHPNFRVFPLDEIADVVAAKFELANYSCN